METFLQGHLTDRLSGSTDKSPRFALSRTQYIAATEVVRKMTRAALPSAQSVHAADQTVSQIRRGPRIGWRVSSMLLICVCLARLSEGKATSGIADRPFINGKVAEPKRDSQPIRLPIIDGTDIRFLRFYTLEGPS